MYTNDNAGSNVVSFPRQKKYQENHIPYENETDILVGDLASDLIYILDEEGYDVTNPEMVRDVAVVGEMIRALMNRQDGEHHVFQSFLDNISIKEE